MKNQLILDSYVNNIIKFRNKYFLFIIYYYLKIKINYQKGKKRIKNE
jgi:hypothetical protein